MNQADDAIAEYDSAMVMEVCSGVEGAKKMIAWMNGLIEENVSIQVALVEGPDESRIMRLAHIASQISVYRRIKDAATRALDIASGKKPPERIAPESTEVSTI